MSHPSRTSLFRFLSGGPPGREIRYAKWFILLSCAAWVIGAAIASDAADASAEAAVQPAAEPLAVFSGGVRRIPLILQSRTRQAAQLDLRYRLYQASSTTAMEVAEVSLRKLTILPGQTLLENTRVTLPAVKGRTHFIIEWLDHTNFLGKTDVIAFPTNLLAELRPVSGAEEELGFFDPGNVLKSISAAQGVGFVDLEQTGVANFRGKLAIIVPLDRQEHSPREISGRVKELARGGAAVLWILPTNAPEPGRGVLQPSFQKVAVGTGWVLFAQPELFRDLEGSPQAQNNLVSLCKIVLNRKQPSWPVDFFDEQ